MPEPAPATVPSPAFSAVERRRSLPEAVAAALEDEIRSGRFGPGRRLPTEAELSAQFDVGRNVVREAVARLKRDGLVESRQGRGAFVAERPKSLTYRIGTSGLAGAEELRHVFELRAEVEAGAAALAAERRTPAQMKRIRKALAGMAAAIDAGADGVAADAEFHQAIAEASNNPIYRDLMVFLAVGVTQSIAAARRNSAVVGAWTPAAQAEHERVCAAIEARDAEAAREAVRAHLDNAARRLALRAKQEGLPQA